MFGLQLFYDAFFDLANERNIGMTVMPIPWSAIIAYANNYGICGEQREDLLFFVRAMDNAFVKDANKPKGKK